MPCIRVWSLFPNCSLERWNKLTFSVTSPMAIFYSIKIIRLFFANPMGKKWYLITLIFTDWFLMNVNSFVCSLAIFAWLEFHGQSIPPLMAPSEGGDYQFLCSAWIVSLKSRFHGILPVSFVFREQNNSPIHWKKLQPARNLRTSIFSTWILTSENVSCVWSRYGHRQKQWLQVRAWLRGAL